jgi:tRNA(Leu) C34 or U34 (ribose-2'-O)-methylase TrmL
MSAAVLLCEPKFAHNVGNALRACALLGAGRLYWSGTRVPAPEDWEPGARLPREERMKCYAKTQLRHVGNDVSLEMLEPGYTPVCVEIREGAEDLRDFVHPENALYVFGPEDGNVNKAARLNCHRFVRIPTADPGERTPYNLAFCVGAVLLDRLTKQTRPWLS